VRYRFSLEAYLQADLYAYQDRSYLLRTLFFGWLFAIANAYSFWGDWRSIDAPVAAYSASIIGLLYSIRGRRYWRRWRMGRQWKRSSDIHKDAELEWQFAEGGYIYLGPFVRAECGWQCFNKVVQVKNGFVMFQSYQQYTCIPRHAFSSDADFQQVANWAKAKVKVFQEKN
jgi:hypothetical protein